MTESQIKFVLKNHKKSIALLCGVSEQAVYKWSKRDEIPEKYLSVLQNTTVEEFFTMSKGFILRAIEHGIEAAIIKANSLE